MLMLLCLSAVLRVGADASNVTTVSNYVSEPDDRVFYLRGDLATGEYDMELQVSGAPPREIAKVHWKFMKSDGELQSSGTCGLQTAATSTNLLCATATPCNFGTPGAEKFRKRISHGGGFFEVAIIYKGTEEIREGCPPGNPDISRGSVFFLHSRVSFYPVVPDVKDDIDASGQRNSSSRIPGPHDTHRVTGSGEQSTTPPHGKEANGTQERPDEVVVKNGNETTVEGREVNQTALPDDMQLLLDREEDPDKKR